MTTSNSSTGKFSGYLICSDFDGTIACPGLTISRENLDAIRYFESEGGVFTLATGRFPDTFMPRGNFGINTYVVSVNGSVIADISEDRPRVVWERNIDPEIIKNVGELLDVIPGAQSLTICSDSESITLTPKDPDNSKKLEDMLLCPVCKFIVVQNPAITPELRNFMETRFPDLNFEMSWGAGLEGLAPGACKGSAVKKLRELIGGIHTVIAVGDYENDISMIKYADIGYAVSNAISKVKEVADRITVSNREHAIAAIVEELDTK